ncbi:MAG: sensor histidine kinase [Actinoallomurus sp.]
MYSGPSLIRRFRPDRRMALDCSAAGAYTLPALVLLLNEAEDAAGPPAALAGAVAFALGIALGRRRPLASFTLVVAGLLVVGLAEPRAVVAGLVPMAYALFRVAAGGRRRTAFTVLVVALAVAMATALPDLRHRGAAVVFGFLFVTVWTVGYAVGMHRRYTENLLRDQAELAEAELGKARRGVIEERLRIARELHDVVAHGMSVITVQAGFATLIVDERPEEARAALSAIESTGRQALTEMRRLLGVLRDPDGTEPELTPVPGLADLDRLVEQTAKAGVRVDLTIAGRPRVLPAGLGLSAYRIVQEAFTNVVKHAGTGSARAALDYREEELVIEVTDDGRGCPDSAPRPGHGLAGMRERVHLYDGAFEAAPLPGRGFRVSARLPMEEPGRDGGREQPA